MNVGERFSMRSARSGPIVSVFAMVLVVETGVLHLVLAHRHPLVAWILTASSLSVLVWLVADHIALARASIGVEAGALSGTIGRRLRLSVPLDRIASVIRPEWRDLSNARGGYVNATKPATPNILVVFREPVEVRLLGMPRRIPPPRHAPRSARAVR